MLDELTNFQKILKHFVQVLSSKSTSSICRDHQKPQKHNFQVLNKKHNKNCTQKREKFPSFTTLMIEKSSLISSMTWWFN